MGAIRLSGIRPSQQQVNHRSIAPARTDLPAGPSPTSPSKSGCACGGGCPRCAQSGGSHANSQEDGLHLDGGGLSLKLPPGQNSIFMDDPPKGGDSKDKPKTAPAKPKCPPTIEVAQVIDAELTEDNVKAGFLTGVGGVAEIRVSDPSGQDWAGTEIHENIKPVTNTCNGLDNCTNTQGKGGAKGSAWKVGDAAAGLVNLPSKKNTFYDLHLALVKYSVLHDKGLDTCTQTCEQYFDCPGSGQIGTKKFTIKRVLKKGKVGGKDVSLVTMTVS